MQKVSVRKGRRIKREDYKGRERKGSGEALHQRSWKAVTEGQAEKGCRGTQETVPKPCILLWWAAAFKLRLPGQLSLLFSPFL